MNKETDDQITRLIKVARISNPDQLAVVSAGFRQLIDASMEAGVVLGLKHADTITGKLFDRLEQEKTTITREMVHNFLSEYISETERAFKDKSAKQQ